jgi:FAD/FMN-containing dehydrogenase
MADDPRAAYRARADAASAALRQAASDAPLGLSRRSSNLFRDRDEPPKHRLDLSGFDHVIEVDTAAGWVDAEARIEYEALVDATLAHGCMPAVVPQLKSITAGGAVAGVGIEATSFRHGLVHDTLLEADVLLADGTVVTARPDNAHRDLFLGLANSYGTLGYLLRLRLATVPVRPFVRVEHRRLREPDECVAALQAACDRPQADFVEGVAFGPEDFVLSVGRFVQTAPETSDYGWLRIYHRSLHARAVDHLRTRDWLWRWDTDWFWCSRNFGAEYGPLRLLLGRRRLNSRTWSRWMRWNARHGVSRRLARWRGVHVESVIQDVDLPFGRAADFLRFLLREIGIVPIWLCPIRAGDPTLPFTLYPLATDTRYLNFGFWDVIERHEPFEPGHFNRLIEQRVIADGGIKSLYSDAYFTREVFARAYRLDAFDALKARYDPQRRLLGLYEKCVLRA